jgi:Tol biopolymer transport system component
VRTLSLLLVGASLLLAPASEGAATRKHVGGINARPVWSPDGKWIAFQSNTGPRPYGTEMWVMRANGSSRHDLGIGGGFAAWSPDSRRLVFATGSTAAPKVAVVDRDGTHRHRFPGGGAFSWSPHNQIAYEGRGGIHAVRPNGMGDHVLVADGTSPEWSPDGTHLTFLRGGDIWRADANGGDPQELTTLDVRHEVRAFKLSPDGNTIAFIVGFVQGHPPSFPFELWRIGSDGRNATLLLQYKPQTSILYEPTWSPNSRLMAFEAVFSLGHDRHDIFKLPVSGGRLRPITHAKRYEYDPDWGRTGRIAFSNWADIYTIANNGRGLRNLTRTAH